LDTVVEVHRHHFPNPWTYSELDKRQRILAEKVRAGQPGTLLLSEVAPVITLGRRTPGPDLLRTVAELAEIGIDLHPTDRGGLATYHGPGQWVLFPVDSLENLTGDRRGVRKIIDALLQIAFRVGRKYKPGVEIRSGCEMGVWSEEGKFAAVGVHIQNGVLLHGLSVNGYRTPHSFVGLRPCGLDAQVDFLLGENSADHFLKLGEELVAEARHLLWPGPVR
jgi:lipoyl(octanoyl) transferase